MSKFATRTSRTTHVVSNTETTTNHEGASSFARTAKSDLFLLGVTNFVSEDTFYEYGNSRDIQYQNLVYQVTKEDPEWVASFVNYLRNTANMRSVSVVTAVEYVRAGGPNGRAVIASACQRADEPAEVLAYWMSTYGRSIPAAVKRGVSDAARRLYHERSFIKYDSSRSNFRFADVIQLAHVKPKDDKQSALFKLALDSRYNNVKSVDSDLLPMVAAYRALQADKDVSRTKLLKHPELISESGMTWESLSSFGPMDKEAWEAVIPSMGYMSLLRNLRNFDESGVSDKVAQGIIERLTDPGEVARSRQLIFRFYSAYANAPSDRWKHALSTAMDLAVKNVPTFKGTTLVLVDTSWSMTSLPYSSRGTITPVVSAALFGSAIAKSGQNVDLRMFATTVADHRFPAGGNVLNTAQSLVSRVGEVGHGTDIQTALSSWNGQSRVIILTDMQTQNRVDRSRAGVPNKVPIYGFNLMGYNTSAMNSSDNFYEFGGLTDNTFSMINSIENSRNTTWPWTSK